MEKQQNKSTRGEKILRILESIEDGITDMVILFAVLSSPSRSYKKKEAEWKELQKYKRDTIRDFVSDIKEWNKFRKLINYLKKEGFLEVNHKSVTSTYNGKQKIKDLKNNWIFNKNYKKETVSQPTIIIYDIPEKYKRKRGWLRKVLISFDYKMIQKSVWLGQTKLSHDFIKDIKKLGLLPFVKIFAVAKSGTLYN